jgi:hypothetical protein
MKQPKQYVKETSVYLIALLGAAGSSLQNFMAFILFLGRISSLTSFFVMLSAGVVSVCSGIVNLCINIDLLKSFEQRLSGKIKTYPGTGWQRFTFYAGSAVFITTGLLFALTAIAFAPAGSLAILGVAAGVFVGLIMMIQELETWIGSFKEEQEYVSFWQGLKHWWNELTLGKAIGILIAVGNTLALSLLLTSGLGLFLMGFGVPVSVAMVVGFTIAFSVGAFTEFYFYNEFLSKFCGNFTQNCKDLFQSKYATLGVTSILINAGVNAALCYAGVFMLSGLALSAGLAFPPLGLAIIAASFGGLASLLLGADFWIKNNKHIVGWFTAKTSDDPIEVSSTSNMTQSLNKSPSNEVQHSKDTTEPRAEARGNCFAYFAFTPTAHSSSDITSTAEEIPEKYHLNPTF